jgi:hypothetical protein
MCKKPDFMLDPTQEMPDCDDLGNSDFPPDKLMERRPCPRSYLGSAIYNDNLYVFTGWADNYFKDVQDMWKFDFDEESWIPLNVDKSYPYTEMIVRNSYAFALVGSKFYV